MRKKDVHIGKLYLCLVTAKVVTVRITAECPYGGWYATNLETGRQVRIRGSQRLRAEVKSERS